jgi:hypothetical protein
LDQDESEFIRNVFRLVACFSPQRLYTFFYDTFCKIGVGEDAAHHIVDMLANDHELLSFHVQIGASNSLYKTDHSTMEIRFPCSFRQFNANSRASLSQLSLKQPARFSHCLFFCGVDNLPMPIQSAIQTIGAERPCPIRGAKTEQQVTHTARVRPRESQAAAAA